MALRDEPALQSWLHDVRAMSDGTLHEAWTRLLSPEQSPDARLLAAALIMAEPGAMPNQVFFAHAWLVMWAADDANRIGRELLQDAAAAIVADAWLLQCRRPAQLRRKRRLRRHARRAAVRRGCLERSS